MDDGKIVLQVLSTNKKDEVKLKVIFGGLLHSRKGVNLPNTDISMPCLTKKDIKDLDFILTEKIEWIGLSFVRKAQDVKQLKKIINKKKAFHKVIAKIEKPEAIQNIDSIIHVQMPLWLLEETLGLRFLHKKYLFTKN